MDTYKEFNEIETIDELGKFIKNKEAKILKKVYLKIKDEYNTSFKQSYYFNEYAKSKLKSGKHYGLRIKEKERNEPKILLEIAEGVFNKYLEVGDYRTLDIQMKINEMSSDLLFKDVSNTENDFEDEIIAIYFMAKFIENMAEQLSFQFTQIAIIEYLTKVNEQTQHDIERLNANSKKTIEESNSRIEATKEELEKSKKDIESAKKELESAKEDIKNANGKIKDINNNMVTIMALFLTAFSIIGVNIYSLNKEFKVNQILLINSSLVFVLSFLMYSLDKIINEGKANLGKIVIWAGVVLMVLGLLAPIIIKLI